MNYDIAIIGAGPGGYTAAIRASQLGKKVALIEMAEVGGTCLNRGCIPTKALHYCAKLYTKMKRAHLFGITADNLAVDLSKMMERKDRVVNQLRKGLEYLFKGNNIDLFRGEAKLNGRDQIIVGEEIIEAKAIILATGSSVPKNTPITVDEKKVFSSNGILKLRSIPKTMAVIGAGAIGIEIATIFNELGAKVTVFEMMPHILPAEDAEIAQALETSLTKRGIEIKTGTSLKDGKEYEIVLVCTGRTPNVDSFEKLGVKLDGKRVAVNEHMQTSLPGVYAIGDVTGRFMFAHTASREGIVAAENICGHKTKMDHSAVPRCAYSDPGVASVGLTEEEASKLHAGIKIGKFPFSASSKSLIDDEREGFVKIVADPAGKILGVHIIGENATEMIGEAALAVAKGLKVEDIIDTIHAHPTVYESMGEAAANVLKQSIAILNK